MRIEPKCLIRGADGNEMSDWVDFNLDWPHERKWQALMRLFAYNKGLGGRSRFCFYGLHEIKSGGRMFQFDCSPAMHAWRDGHMGVTGAEPGAEAQGKKRVLEMLAKAVRRIRCLERPDTGRNPINSEFGRKFAVREDGGVMVRRELKGNPPAGPACEIFADVADGRTVLRRAIERDLKFDSLIEAKLWCLNNIHWA